MAYSAEAVKRAKARLNQAKTEHESQYRARIAQAYEKLPRLQEIDRQLRLTVVLAAQAAFSQSADAVKAMEEAKQRNLALQAERDALIAQSFGKGYLDEGAVCPRCGGAGFLGSTMCQCLEALCREEQQKELSCFAGEAESFEQFRADYYPQQVDPRYGASPRAIMEKNFLSCLKYAKNFGAASGNLLFVGGTGLGKTFLSACIAKEVVGKGFSVVYETAGHLFAKLEQAKFTGNEEAKREVEWLNGCDLLIIDDLGTEMPGQFVTAALYTLVNDRLLAGKPMVISTNLNVDELAKRYSPQIASRLYGGFNRLTFVGEDIRVLKNR